MRTLSLPAWLTAVYTHLCKRQPPGSPHLPLTRHRDWWPLQASVPGGQYLPKSAARILPSNLRPLAHVVLIAMLLPALATGPVAAQSTVGQELCGTPIAEFINSTVPLIVALVIIAGTVFAFLMHVRAGVARDAEQARFYFDWRNRAGYTAVTAPLLAFLLQMLLGFTGTGIDGCINLVPFFS